MVDLAAAGLRFQSAGEGTKAEGAAASPKAGGAWDVRAAIELRLGRVRGRLLPSNERVDGINIEGSGDMAGI